MLCSYNAWPWSDTLVNRCPANYFLQAGLPVFFKYQPRLTRLAMMTAFVICPLSLLNYLDVVLVLYWRNLFLERVLVGAPTPRCQCLAFMSHQLRYIEVNENAHLDRFRRRCASQVHKLDHIFLISVCINASIFLHWTLTLKRSIKIERQWYYTNCR